MIHTLWQLGSTGPLDPIEPVLIEFSSGADVALQGFEEWLEPQLAQGETLASMHGWASRCHSMAARIGGIFHVVEQVLSGQDLSQPIQGDSIVEDFGAVIAVSPFASVEKALPILSNVKKEITLTTNPKRVHRKIRGVGPRLLLAAGPSGFLAHGRGRKRWRR